MSHHHETTSPLAAIFFSFGVPPKWAIDRVRSLKRSSTLTGSPSQSSVPIIFQAQTVEQAEQAVESGAADILVAQGMESGGHGMPNLPTAQLVSCLLASKLVKSESIPVLSAGGVMTGTDIASHLVLGASGVVMGTRFCLSTESVYPELSKQRMLKASGMDTIRSTGTLRASSCQRLSSECSIVPWCWLYVQ